MFITDRDMSSYKKDGKNCVLVLFQSENLILGYTAAQQTYLTLISFDAPVKEIEKSHTKQVPYIDGVVFSSCDALAFAFGSTSIGCQPNA